MGEAKLKEIIKNEISLRLSEKGDFCNIILNYNMNNIVFSMIEISPQISSNGYYVFDISKFSKLKSIPGCTINKVLNAEMIEEILFCNLKHDEEVLGKEFCTRKCYRRGKGYGTTILKALIDIAIRHNAHTIYLVADEDDTAKEMYQKLNFKKVGERADLFFEL